MAFVRFGLGVAVSQNLSNGRRADEPDLKAFELSGRFGRYTTAAKSSRHGETPFSADASLFHYAGKLEIQLSQNRFNFPRHRPSVFNSELKSLKSSPSRADALERPMSNNHRLGDLMRARYTASREVRV